jgi:hypothetical protein
MDVTGEMAIAPGAEMGIPGENVGLMVKIDI